MIEETRLEPGWLRRDIEAAKREIAAWPEGLRRHRPAARYEESNSTMIGRLLCALGFHAWRPVERDSYVARCRRCGRIGYADPNG